LGHGGDEVKQQQTGNGQEMQAGGRPEQAFVAPRQAAEARRPCEGVLDHPAARQ